MAAPNGNGQPASHEQLPRGSEYEVDVTSHVQAQQQVPAQDQPSKPWAEGNGSPPSSYQGQNPDTYYHSGNPTIPPHQIPQMTLQQIHPTLQSIFHPSGGLKWAALHSHRLPSLKYRSPGLRRHRDFMRRLFIGEDDDRYPSPSDGRLVELIVQTTGVERAKANATWIRTKVRDNTPYLLRLVYWTKSSLPRKIDEADLGDQMRDFFSKEWGLVYAKWIPACCGLFVLMWIPASLAGQIRNHGFYDPWRYRYWGYPKAARNPTEDSRSNSPICGGDSLEPIGSMNHHRLLKPRWLCVLREGVEAGGIDIVNVEDWHRAIGAAGGELEYIFVAYTGEQFSHGSTADLEALHEIAQGAARKAGVKAYWVACSCMREPELVEEDVLRINDVVRGAHSLAVAVGRPSFQPGMSMEAMLRQWGERLWTWPEILLSPRDHPIRIYVRGGELEQPLEYRKRNIASLIWKDADEARQMIDHYEGSLVLAPLEFVVIALQCLQRRLKEHYLDGDKSYALMGLLRRRPKVNRSDSAFQAFARLSLANDSNMLLERMICTLPRDINAPWEAMEDSWGVKLWDIYPTCQIAGVADNDTVILDGVFGATIRWKSFTPVAFITRNTWKRTAAKLLLRGVPLFFITAVILVVSFRPKDGLPALNKSGLGIGAFLLAYCLVTVLAAPYLFEMIYGGKVWNTQAWFFGFEGYMDIATIERNIFGTHLGRLNWSTYGSLLSRHIERDEECIGLDPTTDPETKLKVQRAKDGRYGDLKVFTLVDTYSMTVTMFEAVRPPVAVLLCGHEGGMQRAVLCSYDWSTQTLYRETVLRMETLVLERMFRVGRLRFGLKRPPQETKQC